MKLTFKWRELLVFLLLYLVYQMCFVPIIDSHQTIFPMKVNEIKNISIFIEENEDEKRYMGLNAEQKREFVENMNQIVLLQGEKTKGSIAYICHYEGKPSNPKNAPIVAEIEIDYKRTLLQRKTGIRLYVYEDNSFLVDEVRSLRRVSFTSNKVAHTSAQVYEHGRETFADGSENQEAVKALLQLIDNQKAWFPEHQ